MLKRFILLSVTLVFLYVGFLSVKILMQEKDFVDTANQQTEQSEQAEQPTHKVYSFTFAKYTTDGVRELEIEADSADIFSSVINLTNVIAKAYAAESPVTITADRGVFDKSTSQVHLKTNVVATTDSGARLISSALTIDPLTKTLETDQEAQVKKGNIDIVGTEAKGDSDLKQVAFKRNVTVVIQSSPDEDLFGEGVKKKSRKSSKEGDVNRTVITCDGPLEIDYESNIAHFYNNVVAKDKRGTLTADKMDVYYSRDKKKVAKIIATGDVIIENPEGNITYSDHVIYLAEEGRIILGGDPEAAYMAGSRFEESPADPSTERASHVTP